MPADDGSDLFRLTARNPQVRDLAATLAASFRTLGVEDQIQSLRQGEKRHGQGNEADSALQVQNAERKAWRIEQRTLANGRQDHAEHGHHQRLGNLTLARKGGNGRKTYDHQREVFSRVEQQGDGGQPGREPHQQDGADGAPGEGGNGGNGQRLAGLSLARQGIAVERRGDRTGHAWRIDQDRRGGTAEDCSVVHTGQQNQRGRGITDLYGDGDHDGDDRHGAQARQHADKGTDQAPGGDHEEVLKTQGGRQTGEDSFKHQKNQGQGRRKIPSTSCTRYQIRNAASTATGTRTT